MQRVNIVSIRSDFQQLHSTVHITITIQRICKRNEGRKKASEDEEEEKMVGAETFAKRRRKTHTHTTTFNEKTN